MTAAKKSAQPKPGDEINETDQPSNEKGSGQVPSTETTTQPAENAGADGADTGAPKENPQASDGAIPASPVDRFNENHAEAPSDKEDGDEHPENWEAKAREQETKEGALRRDSDRQSVFDASPSDSERGDRTGKEQDVTEEDKKQSYFTVTDEADLFEVAAKVGLQQTTDVHELAAVNAIHNLRFEVRRGQKVLLPDRFTYTDVEGVTTE